jgi:hypothetical protein
LVSNALRPDEAQDDQHSHAGSDVQLTFSHSLVISDHPEFRDRLNGMVVARNRLAHCFLDDCSLETLEDCENACLFLDKEYEAALSLLHFTRSVFEERRAAASVMLEFMNSEACALHLVRMTTLAPFVSALEQEAMRLRRKDGWCVFESAAHALRLSQPDLIAELLSDGEYKSIRSAAEAAESFQWQEEPTRKGARLLFRWKSD